MKEVIEKIAPIFCQHCKALQKVNKTPVKCWHDPNTDLGEHAFCGSILDAIESLLSLKWPCEKCGGEKTIPCNCMRPDCDEEVECDLCNGTGEGQPMIGIIKRVQEVPKLSLVFKGQWDAFNKGEIYQIAQKDMRDAGFVQIEKE